MFLQYVVDKWNRENPIGREVFYITGNSCIYTKTSSQAFIDFTSVDYSEEPKIRLVGIANAVTLDAVHPATIAGWPASAIPKEIFDKHVKEVYAQLIYAHKFPKTSICEFLKQKCKNLYLKFK